MKWSLFIVTFLFGVMGCAATSQQAKHSFGIYLVKDGKFTEVGKDPYYLKSVHVDLHASELLEEPVISDRDIVEYNWTTHTVKISSSAAARIPRPDSFGIPFIVVADGHRCYVGGFWTSTSSVACPSRPIIDVEEARGGIFRIERGWYPVETQQGEDPRNDTRIYECLKALGKLKE